MTSPCLLMPLEALLRASESDPPCLLNRTATKPYKAIFLIFYLQMNAN